MKYLLLVLASIGLLAGCGPTPPVSEESGQTVIPTDLNVEVGHRQMTVTWVTVGDALISGYNIYISQNPLFTESGRWRTSAEPFNQAPFPGDLNPDDGIEHYDARGLQEGIKYYVAVRVILSDGTLSEPTRQEEVVLGGRGEITLDYRYSGDDDGFSFSQDEYVGADDDPNDIYYYSVDGQDYLASPIRLSGFQRDSRLIVLPYDGSFSEVSNKLMQSPIEPTEDNVPVTAGDWVLLRTADNTHALLHVLGILGSGKDRRIELYYAYSSLPGTIFF